MVKRRRNTSANSRTKSSQKRTKSRGKSPSLREKFQTTAIWGLGLINLALIFSLLSNFMAAPNETPLSSGLNNATPPVVSQEPITVEVLNACGVNGLANEVSQFLRSHNFDVVNVGDYSGGWNLDNTLILDRVSLSRKNALSVASVLEVGDQQVIPELEESIQLKVTILIGKDYKKLKLFAQR